MVIKGKYEIDYRENNAMHEKGREPLTQHLVPGSEERNLRRGKLDGR